MFSNYISVHRVNPCQVNSGNQNNQLIYILAKKQLIGYKTAFFPSPHREGEKAHLWKNLKKNKKTLNHLFTPQEIVRSINFINIRFQANAKKILYNRYFIRLNSYIVLSVEMPSFVEYLYVPYK